MPRYTLMSGIDTNIRYLPILRQLKRLSYRSLLEVGSRSEGIAHHSFFAVVFETELS